MANQKLNEKSFDQGDSMFRLILGSGSPRRAEILRGMDLDFEVASADIDESVGAGEPPIDYVRRLAVEKAQRVFDHTVGVNRLVLGADTVVVLGDDILGKPRDCAEATEMLSKLSGKTHEVITAVALISEGEGICVEHAKTEVTFRSLSDDEISAYVATGSPYDKAGAYGIQDEAGQFVDNLNGQFSNVVGLPVDTLVKQLNNLGFFANCSSVRLSAIKGRIAAAACGMAQKPQLIAVSKGQTCEDIQSLVALGQRCFGESYLQEWFEKRVALEETLEWHYIGRIQSNKLGRLVETGALIHTICTKKHLDALQRHSAEQSRTSKCLLQIKLGGEPSKAGLEPSEIQDLLLHAKTLPNVRVLGLMTLPPRGNFSQTRQFFATLSDLGQQHFGSAVSLSMGMSGDLEPAILEGATMIRVGTALFGERD